MSGQNQSLFEMITPLVLVSLIFIFFIFRPQQKKISAHKQLLSNLKIDDEIITNSGILGKIKKIEDDIVIIQTESNSMKILKQSISDIYKK